MFVASKGKIVFIRITYRGCITNSGCTTLSLVLRS